MMTTTSSGTIHLLPEHIVDQIKAGEVIERPATLLKELIENSIDAGSTKVSVHIINNGLDLIAVEDNGSGISFDQLPLAFCRHATSKINIFEDLYRLYSYGFRGEALASMASVSKISCQSNQAGKKEGSISFHGGELISHRQEEDTSSEMSGTKIYVKDLFYNTPVRIKFLQSQTTEKNQLKRIINAFVLTHPEIEFTIRWDDSPKDFFPIVTNENITERIKKVFEKKKDPLELIHFMNEYDGLKVKIVLSHNASKGNSGKFHYLFINGRFIQDPQLHKIILNSAQSIWPFGLTGNYVVYLEVPPEQLDINVHPNKTVVKLFQPSKVFSLISSSIKKNIPQSQIKESSSAHSLELEENDVHFKNINYKDQDFSTPETLEDYFKNLDNIKNDDRQIPHPQQREYLLKDHNILLYKEDNRLFLIHTQKFLQAYVDSLFQKASDFTPMPLLVSSPLNSSKKISDELLALFQQKGIEVDFLEKTTPVLRSFPRCLSDLPYGHIIQGFIDNEKDILKEKRLFLSHRFSIAINMTERVIEKAQQSLNITELMRTNIMKELHAQDFLRLL